MDLPLELGGYLAIVVEGRALLDLILICSHLDELPLVVHPQQFHGDEGGAGAQEAHLHADILGTIAPIYEQVVYLADLLVVLVVDLVASQMALDRREPVAALLSRSVLRHVVPPRLTYRP